MSKTKAPKGLTITRDGMKFICEWKISDKDYGNGQRFEYSVNNSGKWKKLTIGASATSKSFTLSASDYYPTAGKPKLTEVSFQVQGNRKGYKDKNNKPVNPGWSAWSSQTFKLAVPKAPVITPTFTAPNVTEFEWSVATSASDKHHFVKVEYGTVFRSEDLVTNGGKITSGWSSSNGSATGTQTYTESSSSLSAGSRTRWFRVRAKGCAGDSAWVYSKHIYASPFAATGIWTQMEYANQVLDVKAYWSASYNAAHPIDTQEVQYATDVPSAGGGCPNDASWSTGLEVHGATASNGAHFVVDTLPDLDECLFLRVLTKHDNNITYSSPYVAMYGTLKTPTNVTLSQDSSTYRATITATNASEVPDSKLAVVYRPSSAPSKDIIVGVIAHGSTSVTVQCPNWSAEQAVAFGVFAYQGTETAITRADGVSQYAIKAKMTSATEWKGGSVAAAPTNVQATPIDETPGEVMLTWNWAWQTADVAEISWSQNINAWESTDEPSTYQINNLHAAKWRVSSLATGVTWYFRVRLGKTSDDVITWGPYCDPVACDLASAPATPALYLSDPVITANGSVTATWAFVSTDGTLQSYAEICTATISSSGVTYGNVIATVRSAQSCTLDAASLGWTAGNSYNLCVRVVSASGRPSPAWSDPATVYVANTVSCTISSTSLETVTVTDDDSQTRTVTALTEMPLTVTITGGDTSKVSTLAIERAETYIMDRPDESEKIGYEGETVYLLSQAGATSFTVNNDDLIGMLDDGAKYRIVATIQDSLGQTASASLEFVVMWEHQAIAPEAEVVIDNANLVAYITPTEPDEYEEGDICDVYRLSADKPELIIEGAEWDTMYVDPYPTLGEMGGYRVVFRTVNGDYITPDNHIAWADYTGTGYILDYPHTVINFGGDMVDLEYDITVSNAWKKDFQETKYLGGSVKGDWNAAVSRTSSVGADVVTLTDQTTIQAMRRLATYAGICHVRTPEGSSYSADVQVSEDQSYNTGGKIAAFSISITRVDPEELDGLPYSEWHVEGATGET